jgi:hypothetical protein
MVTMDGEMWHWNNKLQSQDLSRMHMLQILGSFEVSARKSSCSYAYFTSIHTRARARAHGGKGSIQFLAPYSVMVL